WNGAENQWVDLPSFDFFSPKRIKQGRPVYSASCQIAQVPRHGAVRLHESNDIRRGCAVTVSKDEVASSGNSFRHGTFHQRVVVEGDDSIARLELINDLTQSVLI